MICLLSINQFILSYQTFADNLHWKLLRTCIFVCTCVNLTFSLHLPSTKSHVHISPFSDELTRKLLSKIIDARDKHKTGAVCPTNKHLGVIFKVSGFTFLLFEKQFNVIAFFAQSMINSVCRSTKVLTINKSVHRSNLWPMSSNLWTERHWIRNVLVHKDPKEQRVQLNLC